QNLRRRFDKHFTEMEKQEALNQNVDPAVGFAVAYLQFFSYFLVEKLFGGNHHLGISDDQAILVLSEIFCHGILHPNAVKKLESVKQMD
ncbi:MAG: hypothetical protein JNN15_09265, partial [Blastocatellia bacterium]|nr:hypothetical protein [Blastocatellia bacterium]